MRAIRRATWSPVFQKDSIITEQKKSLAGQGFFYPWRVQRDRTSKCQLWNLIKPWTEWKGMQTTFGGLLRKFVDCLSVHMGDHRGSRWISWDAGMTLCVEENVLVLKRHQLEYLWMKLCDVFQLTSSRAEKKWGREKANVEPRLRVCGYDLLHYSLPFI